VSYGTDPAYSADYLGTAPDTAVAPLFYENKNWAWMQVEGIGLVKNGPNPSLGRNFIDYCLNVTVQQEIALNQWMFPVRSDIDLPDVYDYAIHPDEMSILNTLFNSTEIATNLQTWLQQYDVVMIPG
jgi:thiamine transport system substrate-binding protein